MRWNEALNAREWATLIWAVVGLGVMLRFRDIRWDLLRLVRTLFSKTLVVPSALMSAYIAGVVFVASRVDLWDEPMIGATVAWFAFSALAGFFRVIRVTEDRYYFRTAVRRAVEIAAIIDAYVNLFVLPFGVEMVLVPILVFLAVLVAVSEAAPELQTTEYDMTRSCLRSLTTVLGVGILTYATVHVIGELSSGRGLSELGRSLLLPLWLNLALIPFTYVLAGYIVYQSAFVMLRVWADWTPLALLRARVALLCAVRTRLYALATFGPPWPYKLHQATSFAETRNICRGLVAERSRNRSSELVTSDSDLEGLDRLAA